MDQAIAIGFAVPAISIGMCAIFACFWYYNREDRAAPLFAAAFTMCALGFFLNHFVLAKETMANAILHNSCYALGLYFLSDGLHRSFDRRTPYEALAALGILSVVLAGIIQLNALGLAVRIITINMIHGGMLIVSAWTLRTVWKKSWTGTAVLCALALCILNLMLVSPTTLFGRTVGDATYFQSAYWYVMNLLSILSILSMGGALISVCVMERLDALRDHADNDFLTGLKSRRAFETAASHYCEVRSGDYAASVVLIDLDYFKLINDKYGHAAGDAVIRAVGYLLCHQTRTSDMCGRMGGEEFCLVLPGTDLDGARTLSERLRKRLSELNVPGLPNDITVTASFGIAELGRDDLFEDIYPVADAALYAAKSSGRDKVVVASAPRDRGRPVKRQRIDATALSDRPARLAS